MIDDGIVGFIVLRFVFDVCESRVPVYDIKWRTLLTISSRASLS